MEKLKTLMRYLFGISSTAFGVLLFSYLWTQPMAFSGGYGAVAIIAIFFGIYLLFLR